MKLKMPTWTCCKCGKVFDDGETLPAVQNIVPGFARCDECYKKERQEEAE